MMKRIDLIENLDKKCTGCMACVDSCPAQCISPVVAQDGFRYTVVDEAQCISCGKCYSVCPIEMQEKHCDAQHLFAAYAIDTDAQNRGSSGGVFEVLSKYFLAQGYYVCGAAFEGTTLKHRIIKDEAELKPLMKSKYVQSDTEGIYKQVQELLKAGERVFFCGTPCQVAALINATPKASRRNLFTADIICHGVPSQKVFDDYVQTLAKKHQGKISEFSFRVKNNRFKHAHGYAYKVTKDGRTRTVNGIYTHSTFYNAFKNYLFLRNSCYECRYATLERVSDITLADFWGIEKYDFKANIDTGVSMIITNTQEGQDTFLALGENVVSKEFPVEYGVQSNFCLTNATKKPKNRDIIIEKLASEGYEAVAKKYFGYSIVFRFYWLIPPQVRNLIRKVRGRK